jgi:rare lipoprotein A
MTRVVLFVVLASSLLVVASVAAQTDTGLAGIYDDRFVGKPTASGEAYDPQALTAAHRTLRFGIRLAVTNPANGASVTVRINDRGPFVEGRLLDLSRAAAVALGLSEGGVAPVEVRVLRADETAAFSPTPSPETYFQMGAFRTEGNAQALARTLTKQGYEPRLRQEGTLYRVYLRTNESAAAGLIEKLNRDGRNGFLQVSKEPEGALLKLSTE